MSSSDIGGLPTFQKVVGKGGDGGDRNPTPPHHYRGVGGGGVPEVGAQNGGESPSFERLTLGVDFGTQGAVALVDSLGGLVAVEDLSVLPDGPRSRPHINAAMLADLLRAWQPTRAYVEFVGARPTDSRVGAFSFGMARGSVEAVLATLAIPARSITAPAWKPFIGIAPGTGQKSTARAEATRRWPQHAALFARARDDGRAEAALIAIAGMAREARNR